MNSSSDLAAQGGGLGLLRQSLGERAGGVSSCNAGSRDGLLGEHVRAGMLSASSSGSPTWSGLGLRLVRALHANARTWSGVRVSISVAGAQQGAQSDTSQQVAAWTRAWAWRCALVFAKPCPGDGQTVISYVPSHMPQHAACAQCKGSTTPAPFVPCACA